MGCVAVRMESLNELRGFSVAANEYGVADNGVGDVVGGVSYASLCCATRKNGLSV